MSKFETQSIMSLRDAIYTLLQRGADGDSPFVIERDLAILAVRLECLDRKDVLPLVNVCDELRKAILNPEIAGFPQIFKAFCSNKREEMLEKEAEMDVMATLKEDAREELVKLRGQHQVAMRTAIMNYIRSFGRDSWIDEFAPLDNEA